ncbi:MAG TPA: acyl-CoA dehydrogenase family protein, partial [Pseudolysinimonas sp.]|nr:acyl-CoA dehydrogenase family protein [Pseudolysinimonas sp.]
MKLVPDPAVADFRFQARTWLEENLPDDARPVSDGVGQLAWDRRWQATQFAGGWAGIDWPAENGGRGLGLLEQIVWHEELTRVRAPRVSIFDVAIAHAGPTIIVQGDDEQRDAYLPRILRGETPWCQGFSEPGAGSDLAALSTRGVIDGDEIVITGQKTWTTGAEFCDFGELLVRTDPESERHRGLTWLVMDMSAPGVDIRPILSIDGFAHNCEVFFDEARFPLANVVGGVGNGWAVA